MKRRFKPGSFTRGGHGLRVGFDLDDTLIPGVPGQFPTEQPLIPFGRLLAPERLRAGTVALFKALRQRGCEIWVYTTSLRTLTHVRWLFLCYGVWLDGVVNSQMHSRWLERQRGRFRCSKYPPAFGIDILIDDAEGVVMEGREYFYRVIRVDPADEAWTEKILAAIKGR